MGLRRDALAAAAECVLEVERIGAAVAERVAEQLVRLPFYTTMTDEEQLIVVEALYELV